MQKVFERNYGQAHDKQWKNKGGHTNWNQNLDAQFFIYRTNNSYKDNPAELPCIVRKGAESKYESLLQICDRLAGQMNGSVRGVIDYGVYDAYIELILPYLEFSTCEGLEDLKEMSVKSDTVLFQSTSEGELRILLTVGYFHRITQEDNMEIDKNSISQISLMIALARLPNGVQNNLSALAAILSRVAESTGTSLAEAAPVLLGEMGAYGVDLMDLNGVNMVADKVIKAFRTE